MIGTVRCKSYDTDKNTMILEFRMKKFTLSS